MLQAIANLGGWLLMMGQHDRSESLFYYFRIEDQVPENHLLRFIDRYVSFDFVREKLRASYSETGRPSIDPGDITTLRFFFASSYNPQWGLADTRQRTHLHLCSSLY